MCVCDETDPRVLAGVSGYSAESIHARRRRMKMNFETEQLQSRVCRPPCIPTQCACEPIRARLPGQTKRAALIYGLIGASVRGLHRLCSGDVALRRWRRTIWEKDEVWCCFSWGVGRRPSSASSSLSVYFNYLLVGEMSSSGFRDAELSLFLNAICDVTYNPNFNPRKTVCVSVSCMTKEADLTQMTDCPLWCFLLYIYWRLQFGRSFRFWHCCPGNSCIRMCTLLTSHFKHDQIFLTITFGKH